MTTSSNSPYDVARAQLTTLLNDHNKALPKGDAKISVKEIIGTLIKEGGTSINGLRSFERQDFIDFGFPRALATQAVALLQPKSKASKDPKVGSETVQHHNGPTVVTMRSEADVMRTMPPADLLAGYDPNNPGILGDELNSRSGGTAFLVYSDVTGTKLDRTASAERLQAIIDGVPVTDYVMVNNEPIMPLRVGERPNTFFAENPLYPGRPLRQPGDICDVTNESWAGVSYDVRVLLAVAVARGDQAEAKFTDPESARHVIMAAKCEDALTTFKQRYPRSASALREMTAAEKPTLQINARRSSPVGGGTTPSFPRSTAAMGFTR